MPFYEVLAPLLFVDSEHSFYVVIIALSKNVYMSFLPKYHSMLLSMTLGALEYLFKQGRRVEWVCEMERSHGATTRGGGTEGAALWPVQFINAWSFVHVRDTVQTSAFQSFLFYSLFCTSSKIFIQLPWGGRGGYVAACIVS